MKFRNRININALIPGEVYFVYPKEAVHRKTWFSGHVKFLGIENEESQYVGTAKSKITEKLVGYGWHVGEILKLDPKTFYFRKTN